MTTLWESHHEYSGGLGLPAPLIPSRVGNSQRLAIPMEVVGNSALWATDADDSDFWPIADEPYIPPVLGTIGEEGIETVAFYAPISKFGREHWGIYFIEDRMVAFAEKLADNHQLRRYGYSLAKRFEVAAELHKWVDRLEQFHAATELFSLTATAYAKRAELSMLAHVRDQFSSYQQLRRHHFLDYFDHS